jgi:succinate dehydrogenase / fumarate reductase cytochrome b subunit
MALTGIFLILFLIVHLSGNLQLLIDDEGKAFNTYAYFMTHNPLIKTISYGLYFFILLHAVQGILLAIKNRKSKSGGYKIKQTKSNSWASRNMAQLGILIFVFLCIHMGDFWFKMKFGDLPMVEYAGFNKPVKDLYIRVDAAFEQWWIVAIYVVSMIGLAYHLLHGFQSAFQSLGLDHKKYTPVIRFVGKAYSILIPLGFAIIPLYYYFLKS